MTDKLTSLRKKKTVISRYKGYKRSKAFINPKIQPTTNFSLILNATQISEYRALIDEAISGVRQQSQSREQQIIDVCDKLAVNIWLEILQLIPSRKNFNGSGYHTGLSYGYGSLYLK